MKNCSIGARIIVFYGVFVGLVIILNAHLYGKHFFTGEFC
jgi:hypothetical protein